MLDEHDREEQARSALSDVTAWTRPYDVEEMPSLTSVLGQPDRTNADRHVTSTLWTGVVLRVTILGQAAVQKNVIILGTVDLWKTAKLHETVPSTPKG